MTSAAENKESSIDWRLWFERGSWFVLFAGLGGIAGRSIPSLFFQIFDKSALLD